MKLTITIMRWTCGRRQQRRNGMTNAASYHTSEKRCPESQPSQVGAYLVSTAQSPT